VERTHQGIAMVKGNDAERVYGVLRKLLDGIQKAEKGEISFSEVFNAIPIRECVGQYTVLATTWHIDDIRDRFPEGTSEEKLFSELRRIEMCLQNAAVIAGFEVIEYEF